MKKVILLGIMGLGHVVAHGQSAITTEPSWDGNANVGLLGTPNAATMGESFVAPTDSFLTSFRIHTLRGAGSGPLSARFFVYDWDGSKAVGSGLYTSSTLSVPLGGAFADFSVSPVGGVHLVSGNAYVAFFSASGVNDFGQQNGATLGMVYANAYSGGAFVFMNNGDDFSRLTSTPWDTNFGGTGTDLAFRAEFSAVPEPISFVAFVGSILCLSHRRLSKSRKPR